MPFIILNLLYYILATEYVCFKFYKIIFKPKVVDTDNLTFKFLSDI